MPIPPSMFNTWPAKSEMGHRKKAKSPTPPLGGAFQVRRINWSALWFRYLAPVFLLSPLVC